MSSSQRTRGQRVLVVDGSHGQNRSALAAVQALGIAGFRPVVTRYGSDSLAAASRYCAGVVETAAAGEPEFPADVRRELQENAYLAVLPASDAAIVAVSASGEQYVDKGVLAQLARGADLLMPSGSQYRAAEDLASATLTFPCVVKTSLKTAFGALPAQLLRGPSDVEAVLGAPGPFIVQPFVPGPMHSMCGVMWRGALVVRVHQRHLRLWPPICGDACAAVTTDPDPLLCAKLERLMGSYEGVFQAEFIGDHLLDVNPRAYASLPLATSAGVNLLAYYCDLLRGVSPTPLHVETGVGYRWWEGELRRLAVRARARKPLDGPLRLPRARSMSARSDPKPGLMRLRHVARCAITRDEG